MNIYSSRINNYGEQIMQNEIDYKKEALREAQKRWISNPDNKKSQRKAAKEWNKRNPNYSVEHYLKNKDKYKRNIAKRYRQLKENEPWIIAFRGIRQRAKNNNIDFDLDADYIKSIWTNTCPILGIPLYSAVYKSGGNKKDYKAKPETNSPTIDRIDPLKGYVKGKVCVMSYRANMIKNCGTLEEHKKIVDFLSKTNQPKEP